MKFSYNWIASYLEEKISSPEEVADILTMHSFEVEGVESKGGDSLLDISVLPNRAHDCFSHSGIAREISALTGVKLKPIFHPQEFNESKKVRTVIKNPEATPRISALSIENISVGESPKWIKERLESVGQKPINNIVDATNLVMLHVGQPLHAYDRDKLTESPPALPTGRQAGGGFYALSARPVREGESLATLDDKTREIPAGVFVITDDNRDTPLSIAGIKGGAESKIEKTTKNIVVEAANFKPTLIRETTRALKLRTDASDRFRKEISPELTRIGLEEYAALILETCPDVVIEGFADSYPNPQEKVVIDLPKNFASEILGLEIPEERIKKILKSLELNLDNKKDAWAVQIPAQRLDLTCKEDLVEEVGRIYGYENIASQPMGDTTYKPEINKTEYYCNKLRDELVAEGYSEVMTYSLVSEGEVELANPIANDKNFLRISILPKLKEAYALNDKNKDLLGLKEIKIFEIGKIFKDDKEILALAKAPDNTEIDLDEYIASQEDPTTHYPLPTTSESLRFRPYSQYPFITRDVALWVPATTTPETIEKLLRENAGELLVNLFIFDKYEKNDKISFGFRLVFQSMNKTLTDEEVNKIMDSITSILSSNPSYEIR